MIIALWESYFLYVYSDKGKNHGSSSTSLFIGRWVLPLSGLGGAFVLLIADSLTRFSTVELPVGAITALMGAPAFAYLLYRRSR